MGNSDFEWLETGMVAQLSDGSRWFVVHEHIADSGYIMLITSDSAVNVAPDSNIVDLEGNVLDKHISKVCYCGVSSLKHMFSRMDDPNTVLYEYMDWDKVQVNTPVKIADTKIAHFAEYDKTFGTVYVWANGCTSYTTTDMEAYSECTVKLIGNGDNKDEKSN